MVRRAILLPLAVAALVATPAAGEEFPQRLGIADDVFTRVVDTTASTFAWWWGCTNPDSPINCDNTHSITAYQGASFASEPLTFPMSDGQPCHECAQEEPAFQATVGGGTDPIRYRCMVHSTLDEGKCRGMCGVIHRVGDGFPGTPPSVHVEQPDVPQRLIALPPWIAAPVTFTGSASHPVGIWKVELRIYDTLGDATHYPAASCPGCYEQRGEGPNFEFTSAVTWSQTIELLPGSYVVEAWVYSAPLTIRAISERVAFLVI